VSAVSFGFIRRESGEFQMLNLHLAMKNEYQIKLIHAALDSEYGYVTSSRRLVLRDQIENLEAANAILRGGS
jgi:hypothetical protein